MLMSGSGGSGVSTPQSACPSRGGRGDAFLISSDLRRGVFHSTIASALRGERVEGGLHPLSGFAE
jgi:hypothetical protein